MTKEVNYICNHCQQKIDGDSKGFGIHFTGNKSARTGALRDCENHLCADCARGYHEALQSVF